MGLRPYFLNPITIYYSYGFFFLDSNEKKMHVYFSKDAFDDLLGGFGRKDLEDVGFGFDDLLLGFRPASNRY